MLAARGPVDRATCAASTFALLLAMASCGDDDAAPRADASVDAGVLDARADVDAAVPSSVLISAAAGGLVRSADGLFEIYVTPGALTADTTISISLVAPADVPADIAALSPISRVYSVEPDGLTFGGDGAVGHYSFASIPAGAVSGTSPAMYRTLQAASRSAGAGANDVLLTLASTDAVRLDVVAVLPHLSLQWVEVRGSCEVGIDWGPSSRSIGSPFSAPVIARGCAGSLGFEVGAFAPAASPLVAVPVVGSSPATRNDWAVDESGAPLGNALAGLTGEWPDDLGHKVVGIRLPASGSGPLTPSPTWSCVWAGTGGASARVQAYGAAYYTLGHEFTCGAGATPTGEVMLGESTRVSVSGGALVPATPGAVVNVISETPAVQAACTSVGTTPLDRFRVCEGIMSFDSIAGPPTLTLASSRQTVNAVFSGTRYVISGATGSAMFAATDSMQVSGTPPGGPAAMVDVPAPAALPAPSAMFGTLSGLATPVHVPDGTLGVFYISIALAGSGPGSSFFLRTLPIADAPLLGGLREVPLLEPSMIADLSTRGLTPTQVYVGVANEVIDTQFFPGATTAVRALRMYQLAAADLGP